jgi:NhaA family Na+:H+ antiporter
MGVAAALAVVTWYATYRSGVDATIAGVALALVTPTGPAERLQERLEPATTFVVLPVFALANAGVVLRGDMFDGPGALRVALGVAVGLVVGKPLGIMAGAWIGTRSRVAAMPGGIGWSHLLGAAFLGGIGFTVSVFITDLAFGGDGLVDAAKVAILAASLVSAVLGAWVLRNRSRGCRN